jgi:probable HAF family extracellular repeat protein
MKRLMVFLAGIGLVFMAGAGVSPPKGQIPIFPYSSFEGLGGHTGNNCINTAFDISADGTTVVGNNNWDNEKWGFVWTQNTGMVILPGFPYAVPASGGGGVSADGTIVGGAILNEEGDVVACRWKLIDGLWIPEVLGDLPGGEDFSGSNCLSFDGNIAVGFAHSSLGLEACRWFQQVNDQGESVWIPQGLGDLQGSGYDSLAYGCSADGSIVVGWSDVGSNGRRAFRWTPNTGMASLGVVEKGNDSEAWACSADGSIVVGFSDIYAAKPGKNLVVAFRWTAATGMLSLGLLPGGKSSRALAVSPDGSVVVGRGSTKKDGEKAIIWDAANGMRRIDQVLAAHYVVVPPGWSLNEAVGITIPEPGVLVVIGNGRNPYGFDEAWRAVIVE